MTYTQTQLNTLRIATWLECASLVLLIFVAAPMKHFANLPQGVSVMGPVHGIFFTFYVWTVISAAAGGSWSKRDAIRAVIAAILPFGIIFNVIFLHPKLNTLKTTD